MRSLQAAAWLSCIGVRPTSAAQLVASRTGESPIHRVVALIAQLKGRVESDGKKEQASYDKYACWCEDTMGRKASDISTAKDTIAETQALIVKLKAEIATHTAEIANTQKMIKQNIAAQKEAAEVREGENADYTAEKTESEQCLGALEAAISVLNGAGTGKAGFLATMQEAQLLSVVAGVRGVMMRPAVADKITDSDMQVVKQFVDHPEDFVAGAAPLSALQTAQNPFGDYAPQSTQIQGILKGMYDAFSAGLEKANGEEAQQEKAFRELMATKKEELDTLEATLERHQSASAEKGSSLAENKEVLDNTVDQLAADEEFFEATKNSCKTKASMWSERVRLRTEELQGMAKAIEILSSDDAKKTLDSSVSTFLQVSAVSNSDASVRAEKAWKRIRALARQTHSLGLARITADLRTGGHFDKVIVAIDKMIGLLRVEEAEDIEHRDRCQGSQNKNKNDKEDIANDIKSRERELSRFGDNEKELKGTIKGLEGEIKEMKKNMQELLDLRNKDEANFKKALQDDMDAVDLIAKAIVVMSEFYKRNKIDLALVQQKAPEYSQDPDKAPETSWSDGGYGGRKSESSGIVAILTMIKEDTELEMKDARADEVEAVKEYREQRDSMSKSLDALEASKSSNEGELADVQGKIEDIEEAKKAAEDDMDGENKMEQSLNQDCAWVDTHFDKRRAARKTEMDGLVEAKNYLAGVEAGDEV